MSNEAEPEEIEEEPTPAPIFEKSRIEGTVVLLIVATFIAVVLVGLLMAYQGKSIDSWQTVALFGSGFFSGVLSAYGLFKAQANPVQRVAGTE